MFVDVSIYDLQLQYILPYINETLLIILTNSETLMLDLDFNCNKINTVNWDMDAYKYNIITKKQSYYEN